MSLLIASTALGLSSAAFQIGAGFAAAERNEQQARRAAQQARGYAREDLTFQQTAISDQAQELRLNAIAQAHQMDMQQEQLSEQAAGTGAEMVMDQAIRGVRGSGTMRAGERMMRAFGREQSVFNTKREVIQASYLSGVRGIERARAQAGAQASRTGTAINDSLQQAYQQSADLRQSSLIQGGFAVLQTGLSYGIQAHEAGHWAGAGAAARRADRAKQAASSVASAAGTVGITPANMPRFTTDNEKPWSRPWEAAHTMSPQTRNFSEFGSIRPELRPARPWETRKLIWGDR